MEHGIDGMTVSEIVENAGVSRPTLYSYFGDVGGAAAEVWLRNGPSWVTTLVESPEFAQAASLPHDTLMAELILAAARLDELHEAVIPDLRLAWDKAAALGESALLRCAWRLGVAIGTEACRSVLPAIDLSRPIVSWLDDLTDDSDR